MDSPFLYKLAVVAPLVALLIYLINFSNILARFVSGSTLKKYRKLLNVYLVTISIVLLNYSFLVDNLNHYKLAFVDFSRISPSSPISIPVLINNYTGYDFHGYGFKSRDRRNLRIPPTLEAQLMSLCEDIEIQSHLEVTPKTVFEQDLHSIRQLISTMREEYPMVKYCFLGEKNPVSSEEEEQDEHEYTEEDDLIEHENFIPLTEDEIITRKWWVFGGSSVWLAKYKVHLMVSRVIYSRVGVKSKPTISLGYVQLFDRNWNELQNYRLNVNNNGRRLSLNFPMILKVPIYARNRYMGPEDPRILVRNFKNSQGEDDQEPIVVFNMVNKDIEDKRGMHVFKPFSDEDSNFLLLRVANSEVKGVEKNWVPFFDSVDQQTHIGFVYNLDPLLVVKCSLSDGICNKIFVTEEIDNNTVGSMRGGTNLVEIPQKFFPKNMRIDTLDRQYWLGFPRSHNDECGCVSTAYRPHFLIFSKNMNNDFFQIEYVSSLMDFNIDVLPWNTEANNICDGGISVLIPNSIAYWDFLTEDQANENEAKLCGDTACIKDDYMGITFSEADSNVIVLHVRGFYKNILKILANNIDYIDEGDDRTRISEKNMFLNECAVGDAKGYCQAIGNTTNPFP
ncbi:hypothetical protein PACTADRAFT_47763 [Pachysolen tannophilus NRRL Y-2460]|uniref:Uncharacterized protein n=1 Tax=Pachysolen tannophilus NRRL Y-2460 TaxID=669874 RepID=A0A1E4U1Q3_PACTA|nr:hypothetical protein PACTADRAFT_47763 [Pachysolen tannophilus NRRL Y-2460]